MTKDELDHIAALYEASTKGDWIADSQDYPNEIKSSKQHQGFVEVYNTGDAELIVAMHNALPELIALARAGIAAERKLTLYEVTNGYIGESYVRVYVWAISEAQALELAQQSFKSAHPNNRSDYSEDLTAKLLFKSDSAPFATRPSDDGWRDRDDDSETANGGGGTRG